MAGITLIGGDEDPLSQSEQREWDRIQFNSIIAPYAGSALFGATRIQPETTGYSKGLQSYVVPLELPSEN